MARQNVTYMFTQAQIMSSLGLEQQQIERFLKIHFECAYYSFFLFHLELK